MFGATMSIMWVVIYTKNGTVFYLSDSIGSTSFTWTQKKKKAKHFITEPAAIDMSETIKKTHKNKKINIKVAQV